MSFQIFIFKSYYNNTLLLDLPNDISIKKIYELVSKKINIDTKYIYLTYAGKLLNCNINIKEYNIKNNSTLHLNIRN